MSREGLYIAGTGSFAAEIASWVRASGAEPTGLIELRESSRVGSTIHGLPVISLVRCAMAQDVLADVYPSERTPAP
jgi:hypothetical protein